jgi:hypothetical protein
MEKVSSFYLHRKFQNFTREKTGEENSMLRGEKNNNKIEVGRGVLAGRGADQLASSCL